MSITFSRANCVVTSRAQHRVPKLTKMPQEKMKTCDVASEECMFRTSKFRRSQNPSVRSQPSALSRANHTQTNNGSAKRKKGMEKNQSQKSHTPAEPQPQPREIVQPTLQLITSPPITFPLLSP